MRRGHNAAADATALLSVVAAAAAAAIAAVAAAKGAPRGGSATARRVDQYVSF